MIRTKSPRVTIGLAPALILSCLLAIVRTRGRNDPDVTALASLDDRNLSILAWHDHGDDLPEPDAAVESALRDPPVGNGDAILHHFRIGHDHSNAFSAWQTMGSSRSPTTEQYGQLEHAGKLAALGIPQPVRLTAAAALRVNLPRQAVSLLEITLRGEQ